MKRLFLSLVVLSLVFPQALLAQEKTSMENSTQVGNVACADYHPDNSVDVLVEADTSKTVPGVTVNFEGSVVNRNTYPIVDGKVVVKIYYRIGEEKGSVVDQFVLPDTFTLPAQSEKKVSFSWHVPENAKGGDYYAATFFTTVSRYQLSGLTFADDMVVNFAGFAVTSTQNGGVFLDDSKTTLNGKAYQFTTESPRFQKGENVEAKVVLTNPSDESQVIQLTWEEYTWDGEKTDNLLRKQFELIFVDAKASKELTYAVGPKDTTTYLVVTTKDQYAKSIEGIRFMREGTPETKFNFSSILKFPLVKGESNSLFACASASTMASVGGNTLTLTLKDAEQNIIHEYTYQGNLSTDKAGFKDDFTPDDNYSNITLTSTIKRGDEVVDEVIIPYDCNAIDKTLCNESVLAHLSGPKKLGILLVILLSLVALGAIFISQHNSMKRNSRFKVLFFALIFGGVGLFGGAGEAQGAMVQTQWTIGCPGGWISTGLTDDTKNNIRHLGEQNLQGGEPELCIRSDDPAVTLTSTWGFGGCPGGTSPTGLLDDAGAVGSPDDFPARHNLNEENYRPNGSNAYRWCLGASGGGATSVSGRWHTLFSSVHEPACNVDETFIVGSHLFIHNLNLADFNGANQESLCVKINSSNPPTAPTLTGPVAGFTNTNYPYTTQATDPDGDTLRYGIDWDNNGTPDGWTGYVNSGTSAVTNHMWIAVGSYTIRALAEDVNGARSGWSAPLTVVISAPISGICGAAQGWPTTNPPVIGLCTSGNPSPVTPAVAPGPYSWSCLGSGGGVDVACSAPYLSPAPTFNFQITAPSGTVVAPGNLMVNLNDNLNIVWSGVTNATGCTGTGTGWDVPAVKSIFGGNDNIPATATTTYTLTCTGPGGITSKAIAVTIQSTLKICQDACDSLVEPPSSFNMVQGGSPKNLVACYNTAASCTDPSGNVTSTATWNENGGSNVVTLSGLDPKGVTANQSGSEGISATYSGLTQNKTVVVSCTDAGACGRDPRSTNLCLNTTFTVVDACGVTQNCNGAKSCDFNWKEVAP